MRNAPNLPIYADEPGCPWHERLAPFSPRESLFIHRLVTLTGCSPDYAASQARQRTYAGRGFDLRAILNEAGLVERSRWGRIPVALADRINGKRVAHGLPPLPRKAIACPLTRFHAAVCH
jgi:hypothetical protein